MFFNNSSNNSIGLDISNLSLKTMQLSGNEKSPEIQAMGKIEVPEGVINEGDIYDMEKLASLIKKLIEKPFFGKITSNRVSACLPETKTFIKLIDIPNTANDLSEVVGLEIQRHVPHLLEEIYYDWQVIEETGSSLTVLAGVAPKEIVNQYTRLFSSLNLSVDALEIEPLVICRSLLKSEHPEAKPVNAPNRAVLDMGASRSSLVFYAGGTIVFTFSIPFSGRDITEKISKNLELDWDKSEKAKIVCGLDNEKCDGVIKKIIKDSLRELVEKIQDGFDFYENYFADRGKINKILLSGGASGISGLDSLLADYLKIEVERGDCFTHLNRENVFKESLFDKINHFKFFDKKNKENSLFSEQNKMTFATATGLALRNVFLDE